MAGIGNPLSDAYKSLMRRVEEMITLGSAGSILQWDMETKMPPRGIGLRSRQLALMEKMGHGMATDPEVGKLINQITSSQGYESLDAIQKRNVHLTKKAYDEATKLPEELVVETARQQAITIDVWKKAKASKDYAAFRPDLEKLFELRKRAAELLMEVKETRTPYDALVDIFEPKMTTEMISGVFGKLRPRLMEVVEKCASSPKPDVSFISRRVPTEVQRKISESLAGFMGYDVSSSEAGGRIDETEHPFTSGYFDDVRITTHYHEDNFASNIFSVLHEGGHALYEQNLPREWMFQPVGSGCSSGIHESQSRFVENIVGRSHEFWRFFLPKLKGMTGEAISDVGLDNFVRAVNKVEPSKIRIESDEVTYSLHIIIRFEIERDLFAGKVTIPELPRVWNEKYEDYLGIRVQNDSEGVMQDTHWASGLFGYFPSYALGNIYDGMILEAMERDLPDWRGGITTGGFGDIKGWLEEHIHKHGNLYDPADLIKMVSGRSMTIEPFIRYLDDKMSTLYGF